MNPTILLYNFNNEERTQAIEALLDSVGCGSKRIEENDYHHPIGYIFGLEEISPSETLQTETIDEEMIIIAGMNNQQINILLKILKANDIRIKYKAVLTPTNQYWDAVSLFNELKREHSELHKEK